MAAGAVLFGLIVRLAALDNPFWYDEVFSASNFFPLSVAELVSLPLHPNNHPLFSMVVHLFWTVFGEGEIQARLPSLLAWGGVLALGWLIADRWLGRRTAWTYIVLASLAFWQYRFSIEARGYELATALGLAGIYLLLSGVYEDKQRYVVLSAPLFVLAAYTHAFSVTLIIGATIIWIGRGWSAPRSDRKRIALAGAVWLTATVVSIALVYLPMLNIADLAGSLITGAGPTGELVLTKEHQFDLDYAMSLPRLMTSGGSSMVASVLATGLWGLGLVVARRRPVALALMLIPLAVVLSSALAGLVYYTRFFVFVNPYFLIGIAAALVWLTRSIRRGLAQSGATVALALALLLVPAGGLSDDFEFGRRDWVSAASFVDSVSTDYVVVYPVAHRRGVIRESLGYYLQDREIHEIIDSPIPNGASVTFVTLPWLEEERVSRPIGEPVRFGDVLVYSLEWDGSHLVLPPDQ